MKNRRYAPMLAGLSLSVATLAVHAQFHVEAASRPEDEALLAAAESPSDAPQALAADLVVKQNRLVSGPKVVRAKKGDRIVLRVTSDAADELHLHGYDLRLALSPGKTATLEFRADKTGRFTYELHRTDLELGAVEIYPR